MGWRGLARVSAVEYEIGRRWARSELCLEALLNFDILRGGAGREENWFGKEGENEGEKCCQGESYRTGYGGLGRERGGGGRARER